MKSEMERAVKEMESQLGEDGITTDDEKLQRHGCSEWSSISIDVLPVAVAYPKSTEGSSADCESVLRTQNPDDTFLWRQQPRGEL